MGFGQQGREGEEGAETEAAGVPAAGPGTQPVSLETVPAARLAHHWRGALLKIRHPINAGERPNRRDARNARRINAYSIFNVYGLLKQCNVIGEQKRRKKLFNFSTSRYFIK